MTEQLLVKTAAPDVNRQNWWGGATFVVLVALLAGLATHANLDLREGRPFLWMDEMIGFDGVKGILAASTPAEFWSAVLDGGDHRYGRIYYNLTALGAWLPYKVWGEPGLIVALRSVQVGALLAAAILLAGTFLRTWRARCLTLVAIGTLPYASYYFTMPKPEPIQLLFYACFLRFAVRKNFGPGWHWAFLGLAFGAKISAAPLCAVAAFAAVLDSLIRRPRVALLAREWAVAGFGFLAGWIIAVPILATPTKVHLQSYLSWTFQGTGHGSDNSAITIVDWLREQLGGSLMRGFFPPWVAILVAGASVVLLGAALIAVWTEHRNWRQRPSLLHPWIVIAMAASLTLPVMLAVKRLWGFYLFPGQVLALVGVAALAEQAFTLRPASTALTRFWRWSAGITATAFALLTCFDARQTLAEFNRLAKRSSEPEFRANLATYRAATTSLDRLASQLGQREAGARLEVAYDPFLFLPDSTGSRAIRVFWGPFDQWSLRYHALVLTRTWQLDYFRGVKPPPPPGAGDHSAMVAAIAAAAEQVEWSPEASTTRPYQFVAWLTPDAGLILRSDVVALWRSQAPLPSAVPPTP